METFNYEITKLSDFSKVYLSGIISYNPSVPLYKFLESISKRLVDLSDVYSDTLACCLYRSTGERMFSITSRRATFLTVYEFNHVIQSK